MAKDQVLIVGGGPSGMILAMVLRLHNVPFRIISSATGPGTLSRAMGVHARTLELYRPFNLSQRAVDEGIATHNAYIRVPDSTGKPVAVARMPFHEMGKGISYFPFILQYPQDHHERMLLDKLTELGVDIEWETTLQSLEQTAAGVSAHIVGPHGDEKATFRFLCGADGAHSKVRHEIDVGFSGGTYEQPFFVADVKLEGEFTDAFMVTVDANTMCLRLPIRQTGMTRLIGLVPKWVKDTNNVSFEDVREMAEKLVDAKVETLNWFSPYHVHHRVADRYRVGDVFLVGDACHVHSPLGGQGMNTGIGDAFNLGWKLAAVVNEEAHAEVLDTYEPERRAFALTLVSTTDRAFFILMNHSWWGTLIRRYIWPFIMSLITKFTFAKKQAFRTVSQIKIAYPMSTLSSGSAGTVKAGQRLPWVDYGNGKDNFAQLDGLSWILHIYGDAPASLQELDWIQIQRFPDSAEAVQAGLSKGSAYLLRPDSYVGLAMKHFDLDKLRSYISRHGIQRPKV